MRACFGIQDLAAKLPFRCSANAASIALRVALNFIFLSAADAEGEGDEKFWGEDSRAAISYEIKKY